MLDREVFDIPCPPNIAAEFVSVEPERCRSCGGWSGAVMQLNEARTHARLYCETAHMQFRSEAKERADLIAAALEANRIRVSSDASAAMKTSAFAQIEEKRMPDDKTKDVFGMNFEHPYDTSEPFEAQPGIWVAIVTRAGRMFCATPGYKERKLAEMQANIIAGGLALAFKITQIMMTDPEMASIMRKAKEETPKETLDTIRPAVGMPTEEEIKARMN